MWLQTVPGVVIYIVEGEVLVSGIVWKWTTCCVTYPCEWLLWRSLTLHQWYMHDCRQPGRLNQDTLISSCSWLRAPPDIHDLFLFVVLHTCSFRCHVLFDVLCARSFSHRWSLRLIKPFNVCLERAALVRLLSLFEHQSQHNIPPSG